MRHPLRGTKQLKGRLFQIEDSLNIGRRSGHFTISSSLIRMSVASPPLLPFGSVLLLSFLLSLFLAF
jgi:hypothetical protein